MLSNRNSTWVGMVSDACDTLKTDVHKCIVNCFVTPKLIVIIGTNWQQLKRKLTYGKNVCGKKILVVPRLSVLSPIRYSDPVLLGTCSEVIGQRNNCRIS